MKQIEESGKTVDLAIEKALKKLGISKEQAEVKIISEGGLLKQAKVVVMKKDTEGEKALAFVEALLEKMGLTFVVELTENKEEATLDLTGTESGCIIGYRGEVLDSIQYLASLVANKGKDDYKRIVVDTENYRGNRIEKLETLARNLESKAVRTQHPVKLEVMNSFERRIIHATLQDSKDVTTVSEGVSPNRYVKILPNRNSVGKVSDRSQTATETAPQQEKPSSVDTEGTSDQSRKSLNFVYRSDKKRR